MVDEHEWMHEHLFTKWKDAYVMEEYTLDSTLYRELIIVWLNLNS